MKSPLQYLITAIFLLPTSISFLLNPLTNDARIYQGVAKLTDYFGEFPANINNAWEIKPIANRGLNYLLYKLCSLFTEFGTWEYEFAVKLCAIAIVLCVCWYFSKSVKIEYAFLVSSVSFLTVLNFIALQAEWWASLFALLAIALFCSDTRWKWGIAGVVITTIFLFKGITILLVIPIICAVYLLNNKHYIEKLVVGAVASVLSLAAILLCGQFPDVIQDMLMSASIARVGFHGFDVIVEQLVYNFIPAAMYIPTLLAGVIAALCLYMLCTKQRGWVRLFVIFAMWVSSIAIVVIQSEFFAYHYVVLIIPAIISILISTKREKQLAIFAAFVIFVAFSSHWSIGMEIEKNFWMGKDTESINIRSNFTDITQQESILYLDPGDAPYYFHSNSSCRFISPLVFQRNSPEWNTSYLQQYKEEYDCIMAYDGKYIITDAGTWFERNTTDNKNVWKKIHSEYMLVWDKSWNIYQKIEWGPVTVFL